MGSFLCSDFIDHQNPLLNFLKSEAFQQIIIKSSDPIYLEPTIYKSPSEHKTLALLTLPLKSHAKFLILSPKLLHYQSNPHINIITLQNFDEIIHKTSLISNHLGLGLLFDYHYYSLLDNLESIARKGLFYKEEEIWYILSSLIQALNYLKENGGFHNNIKLNSIAITSDGGLKILPNHLLGKKGLAFYEMQQYLTKDFDYCYLPPKLLGKLQLGVKIIKKIEKNWKNDVFAIGMIGLELCTLKNTICCFDFEKMQLNFEKIGFFLENTQENYSLHLKLFLEEMIKTEEFEENFLSEKIRTLENLVSTKLITISPNLIISLKKSSNFFEENEEKQEEKPLREDFFKSHKI